MPALVTTQKTTANRELANAIEHLVKAEMDDRYGIYLTDGDTFDLTEEGQILLVNSAGHTADLPTCSRHAGLIAAAIYLRDADGAA